MPCLNSVGSVTTLRMPSFKPALLGLGVLKCRLPGNVWCSYDSSTLIRAARARNYHHLILNHDSLLGTALNTVLTHLRCSNGSETRGSETRVWSAASHAKPFRQMTALRDREATEQAQPVRLQTGRRSGAHPQGRSSPRSGPCWT